MFKRTLQEIFNPNDGTRKEVNIDTVYRIMISLQLQTILK